MKIGEHLSSVALAQEQWAHAGKLHLGRQVEGQGSFHTFIRRIGKWWLAALWRVGIALALFVSAAVEILTLLLAPLLAWVDAILGWILLPVAAPIELVISLPYFGRLLGWLWRLLLTVVWGLLHFFELPLVLIGVTPPRRLRLWVMPVADIDSDRPPSSQWLQALAITGQILQREANVTLIPVGPTAQPVDFQNGETSVRAVDWLQELPSLHSGRRLEVGCNQEALREDLARLGGTFDRWALRGHPRGAFRRVTGWGAPLLAIGVHSVSAGKLAGCSLGPLTDYITLRQDLPICLAHELGHACNLPHSQAPTNLMNPTCGGVHLSRWQVLLLRLSRHVTLF